MSAIPGDASLPGDAAAGPPGRAGGRLPVPPLVQVVGGGPGLRSWWVAVSILWRRSQRSAAGLLAWTVLGALPAAGVIALVAQAFEQRGGHAYPRNSLGWGVGLIFAVPLLPLVIAGGYLIARAWMGAAWVTALRAAGQPAHPGQAMAAGRRRSLPLWAAYLGGVAVLCLVAGLAGDLLANDQMVRSVLVSVGPLGLLGALVLLAPSRIYAGQATSSSRAAARPAGRGRLTGLAVVVLACQLAIGVALSPLVDLARLPGVLGVLVAFALSVPCTLLLAAAGQASYAARHASAPGALPPPPPVADPPRRLSRSRSSSAALCSANWPVAHSALTSPCSSVAAAHRARPV